MRGRALSAAKVKQIQKALAARVHRVPTQTAIAKRFGASREAVSEIARGVYGTDASRARKRADGEQRLTPGYCEVCRCDTLVPCVACAGRIYARLKRARGSYVLPDGTEADLALDLDGVPGAEQRMMEVHG